MQDVCVKISSAGSVGTLVQDLCLRVSCARSLHQDLQSLFQDLCIRTSAGPLVEDYLPDCANATLPAFRGMDTHHLRRGSQQFEIATLPAFSAMDTHDLRRESHFEIRNRNFTIILHDGYTRSTQRFALRNQKSLLYRHSVRWTRTPLRNRNFTCIPAMESRTISAEGCTSKSEIATLPSFCAMDTHDLCRGLHFEIRNRNFTGIPRDGRTLRSEIATLPAFLRWRHARSPQKVALRNQKSQLYHHFARWIHTIFAEVCTSKSEIATLPAFRAMDAHSAQKSQLYLHSCNGVTHDLRRRLHFEIRNRNFTIILRDGYTRSLQRFALRNQKSQLYRHSARWTHTPLRNRNFTCIPAMETRTISAGGCTSKSETATLPAFRAIDTHDLRATLPAFRALDTHDLRRGLTCRNHASEVLRLPQKS